MVWKTHRIAWLLFPVLYWAITWTYWEMWIFVFIAAPFLWILADFDMNEKNTSTAEVLDAFKRQWFIEQSLRIFLKWISWWEHRWLTHSLFFLIILFLLFSPVILLWWTIHTLIGLILAYFSHIFFDMFNNTGVRLFWPHPWKVNFLTLIPNLLKLWKGKVIRAKWFKIHWILKLIGMIITVFSRIFAIITVANDFSYIKLIALLIILIWLFYAFIKFIFVLTWSEEEEMIIYWPTMITTLWIVAFHFQDFYSLIISWGIWLSNHFIFLFLTLLLLLIKWFNIFWNGLKYFFRTSKIWLSILLVLAIIATFNPTNLVNSYNNFTFKNIIEKLKPWNIYESYKKWIILSTNELKKLDKTDNIKGN